MTINNFPQLYLNELRDIYSAERQLVNALPRFIHAISSEDLKDTLGQQLGQTTGQIARLEVIFKDLEESASGHPCKAMSGLITEADEAIGFVVAGPLLDSSIIGCLQKLEHYKIAGYATLKIMAGLLFKPDHVNFITDSITEEVAADVKLGSMAETFLGEASVTEVRSETGIAHGPDGKPFDSLGRDEDQMARDRGVGQGLGLGEGRGQENDPNRVVVLGSTDTN